MFFDIGIALLTPFLVGWLLGVDPTGLFIAVSLLFSVAPDVDGIIAKLVHGTITVSSENLKDHREIIHYPLLFVPIGTAVVWWFGPAWGMLFFLNTTLHFLHDSVLTGWGVKWLWPFTSENYKFFYDKTNTPAPRLVVSWAPEEFRKYGARYGNPHWVRDFYLGPFALMLPRSRRPEWVSEVRLEHVVFLLTEVIGFGVGVASFIAWITA